MKLSVLRLGFWCHRSSRSLLGHCGGVAAVQGYTVPTSRYHGTWSSRRWPRTSYDVSQLKGVWWLEQATILWTFARPHTTSGSTSTVRASQYSTACHLGSRKWPRHQALCPISIHVPHIHVPHSSAIVGPSIAVKSAAGIVGLQSISNVTAPLVDFL